MPGAGSAKAAQFISMIAPRDGTSIAAVMPGAIMGGLLDERADVVGVDGRDGVRSLLEVVETD